MNKTARLTLAGLALILSASVAGRAMADQDSPKPAYMLRSSPARVAAFAKLPDWRGFWEQFDIGASGTPDPAAVARATADPAPDFTDAWIKRMKTEKKHNPLTERVCTFGFPTLLESSPLIFEIISVPEETAMIFNMREVRHIYTDGLGHTPADVRLDTPWGDSIGTWDGATLNIETVSSNALFRFRNAEGKRDNTHLSEDAVWHERLRMLDPNTLEDSFTVVDPQALRKPYHFTRHFHRIIGMTRVTEELDCESSGTNDRNPIVNGKWTLIGPKS